jgi:hypothetical protein
MDIHMYLYLLRNCLPSKEEVKIILSPLEGGGEQYCLPLKEVKTILSPLERGGENSIASP